MLSSEMASIPIDLFFCFKSSNQTFLCEMPFQNRKGILFAWRQCTTPFPPHICVSRPGLSMEWTFVRPQHNCMGVCSGLGVGDSFCGVGLGRGWFRLVPPDGTCVSLKKLTRQLCTANTHLTSPQWPNLMLKLTACGTQWAFSWGHSFVLARTRFVYPSPGHYLNSQSRQELSTLSLCSTLKEKHTCLCFQFSEFGPDTNS